MLHPRRALACILLAIVPPGAVAAQDGAATVLDPQAINAAELRADLIPEPPAEATEPDPGMVRLQVLLDRAGASPGVIDGFDGDNVRKAVRALEAMSGLPVDGTLDPDLLARLDRTVGAVGSYTISDEDAADIVAPLPTDYAELAKRDHLGYTSVAEKLAERFHMDEDLLRLLNPGAAYAPGETVTVANTADVAQHGEVARIEADKQAAQVRAYDAQGTLLAAYPATIGSDDNPSPSGEHTVMAVVLGPDYTYNPAVNFQQGDNTKALKIAPGPNGPVGSVWIDLSEPTYGIHGTPEPSLIDKDRSHGCVRLTNWDAEELAGMVDKGVTVSFVS